MFFKENSACFSSGISLTSGLGSYLGKIKGLAAGLGGFSKLIIGLSLITGSEIFGISENFSRLGGGSFSCGSSIHFLLDKMSLISGSGLLVW